MGGGVDEGWGVVEVVWCVGDYGVVCGCCRVSMRDVSCSVCACDCGVVSWW